MGRTNIVIDEALIRRVMKISGARTKRQAVDYALRRVASQESAYRSLLALRGKARWEGNLDELRRDRLDRR